MPRRYCGNGAGRVCRRRSRTGCGGAGGGGDGGGSVAVVGLRSGHL